MQEGRCRLRRRYSTRAGRRARRRGNSRTQTLLSICQRQRESSTSARERCSTRRFNVAQTCVPAPFSSRRLLPPVFTVDIYALLGSRTVYYPHSDARTLVRRRIRNVARVYTTKSRFTTLHTHEREATEKELPPLIRLLWPRVIYIPPVTWKAQEFRRPPLRSSSMLYRRDVGIANGFQRIDGDRERVSASQRQARFSARRSQAVRGFNLTVTAG